MVTPHEREAILQNDRFEYLMAYSSFNASHLLLERIEVATLTIDLFFYLLSLFVSLSAKWRIGLESRDRRILSS